MQASNLKTNESKTIDSTRSSRLNEGGEASGNLSLVKLLAKKGMKKNNDKKTEKHVTIAEDVVTDIAQTPDQP